MIFTGPLRVEVPPTVRSDATDALPVVFSSPVVVVPDAVMSLMFLMLFPPRFRSPVIGNVPSRRR